MKKLFILSLLLLSSSLFATDWPVVKAPTVQETKLMTPEMKAQYPNVPVCMFARKDYDSQGFGIPKRDGFYIKGQFGCMYYCGCGGKTYYVTHTYRDEYFDSAVWTTDTGGPGRAKWFICPHSVHEDSWKPYYDEVGRLLGYNVQDNQDFFEPKNMSSIKELAQWQNQKCR
ncbi:MAG: hypothetical protein H7177_03275 [Rhizobacter sp.]|nr:hypothetical protein [Bacteriovorax sp.]